MVSFICDQLETSILVRADVHRVFDALTSARELDAWFTNGAEVDLRPGGRIIFRWKDWGPDHYDGDDGGPVLDVQRPELFVFQWYPSGPECATTVRIELRSVAEGTVVRLTDSGYPDTPEGRRKQLECAAGWGEALTLCKFHVEHGVRY